MSPLTKASWKGYLSQRSPLNFYCMNCFFQCQFKMGLKPFWNHICISINPSFYEIFPIILTPLIISQNLDKWKFSISSLGKQNKNIMMFMNEYYNFVHIVTIRCLKTKITEKLGTKIMKTIWPKSKGFFESW